MAGIAQSVSKRARGRLIAAAAGAMALMTPAFAADVSDSMGADEIAAMLEGAGFSTTMMSDKDNGAPVAVARLGQINFVVRALDCEGRPPSCSQLLFFANFNLGRSITGDDYKIVNDFNDSSYEGRAYVLEGSGEIGIDYIIDLTGGVTAAHVESRLSRWQEVVARFLAEMNDSGTGA